MENNLIFTFLRVLFAIALFLGLFLLWKEMRTGQKQQRTVGILITGSVIAVVLFGWLLSLNSA